MPDHIVQHLSEESTVDELLDAIEQKMKADPLLNPHKRKEHLGHYSWTTNQIADALQIPREALTIRQLVDCETQFKDYVDRRQISQSAKVMLRSYRNNIIREAKQLGPYAEQYAFEQEWQCLRETVKGLPAGPAIVRDAIERKLHMGEYSDAVLEDWGRKMLKKGRGYRYVISRKSAFRGAVRRAGLAVRLPLLRTKPAPSFRVSARRLPQWLRHDIALMIGNMRVEARFDLRRFPWSSARGLVLRFQELVGFHENLVRLPRTSSLEQLVSESNVRKFVLFLYEDRGWKRHSIRVCVNRIANALSYHPELCTTDFSWIKLCVQELPEDDDTDIAPTFDGREVLLDDLASIPAKIRAKQEALAITDPRVKAWLVVK